MEFQLTTGSNPFYVLDLQLLIDLTQEAMFEQLRIMATSLKIIATICLTTRSTCKMALGNAPEGGDVVIVLRQPAKYQRYFSDYHQTVKDYKNILNSVDEV